MNIKGVQEIVQKYYEEYYNYIDLEKVGKLKFICHQVLKERELPMSDVKYSAKFNVNKSIRIISKFLETIDVKLKDQFNNIINQTDENNKPLVNFIMADSEYYEKYKEELTKEREEELKQGSRYCGSTEKTYICLNNNLDDIFVIIHELFHHMNVTPLYYKDSPNILNSTFLTNIKLTIDKILRPYKGVNLNDYDMYNSFVQSDYGEVISILMEKLLGQYLVQEGLITENDYNIKMNKRLYSSKKIAKKLIENIELMNEVRLYIFEKMDESTMKKIYEKLNHGDVVISILKDQRYVIAQALLKKYDYNKESINEIILINDYLSNPKTELDEINKIL